jgi:hypothetical protein
MAIAIVVTPARAIAPMDDVWPTNFVADNSANYGADWSCNGGANTCTDTDAFHLTSLGRIRRRKKRCQESCNFPGGAHGYLSVRCG